MHPKSTLPQRFLDKFQVDPETGCHVWTGSRGQKGYGNFRVGKKVLDAYRFAYQVLIGPVPTGLELDHLCRNRACVNPAHLEPVTHRENVRRGDLGAAQKRRQTSTCARGHVDDFYTSPQGKRQCRQCVNLATQRYRERLRSTKGN